MYEACLGRRAAIHTSHNPRKNRRWRLDLPARWNWALGLTGTHHLLRSPGAAGTVASEWPRSL
jgi:hypothetical protein